MPVAALHLDPIPMLMRDGVLSIAVPAEPMGACGMTERRTTC